DWRRWAPIYSPYVLWRTWEVLQEGMTDSQREIVLPRDYRPLIEAVYAVGYEPTGPHAEAISHALVRYRRETDEHQAQARRALVPAVREAALLRVPGIAISHYIHNRRPIDWALATQLTTQVLDTLMTNPLPPGCFWNVNLPHLSAGDPAPDLVFCSACTQPLPTEYRVEGGQFHYVGEYGRRRHDPESDVAVCFSGQIAVTKLCLWPS
ncbi:MAG: hypothetical protein HC929_20605, partial [Leptolyngbyaceae cyanobacterium SM2_5_2]|nr:hypothetical protein [Leptolyngbyaceae cyanobacterium SM2_5_2]